MASIPYEVVDAVMHSEYQPSRMLPSLYILNPNVEIDIPYVYRYDDRYRVHNEGERLTDSCRVPESGVVLAITGCHRTVLKLSITCGWTLLLVCLCVWMDG